MFVHGGKNVELRQGGCHLKVPTVSMLAAMIGTPDQV